MNGQVAQDRNLACRLACTLFWISPPIANVWPDSSITAVRTCCSLKPGLFVPPIVMPEGRVHRRDPRVDFQPDLAVAVHDRETSSSVPNGTSCTPGPVMPEVRLMIAC